MAHGRPDFFGSQIHPKYGVYEYRAGVENCAAGVDQSIVLVSKKGTLVNVDLWITDSDFDEGDTIQLWIDNQALVWTSFTTLMRNGSWAGSGQVCTICQYDPDADLYVLYFNVNLPFQSEFDIRYTNPAGPAVTVSALANYYSVE